LEISYNNVIYQVITNTKGYRLQHATVTVCEDLNGTITILRQGKPLEYRRHDRAKKNADIGLTLRNLRCDAKTPKKLA
jgi:hypothetical protein